MTTYSLAKHVSPAYPETTLKILKDALKARPEDALVFSLKGRHSDDPSDITKLAELATMVRYSTPDALAAYLEIFSLPDPSASPSKAKPRYRRSSND